jgi:diguanylate cyclase (GGDEF)-like protein
MIEDIREAALNPALPALQQRRWTARLGWAGAVLAMVGHGILMATGHGVDPASFALPVFVVGFFAVPASLRRGGSTAGSTGLLLALLLAAIFGTATLGGGLEAPLLVALPMVTILAVLLANPRQAAFTVLGSGFGLLAIALWQAMGGGGGRLTGGQVLRAALLVGVGSLALALASFYEADAKRLRQALRAASTSDPLTGLANRDSLDDTLALEHHRLARHPAGSLSIILIDIDGFEEYGLTYGRQAAEELVRRVAETARFRVRRAPDLLGRQGDAELLAVLPATGGPDAAVVAECIRRDIEALDLPNSAAGLGIVTVSLGVAAELAGDERSIDSLLTEAGLSLRRAKLDGGNRVAVVPMGEGAT